MEKFGIEIIEDSPNRTPAQWRVAAETGNIDWHLSGLGPSDATALINSDSLEELDMSVIDTRDLFEPVRSLSPYLGGGRVSWSIVLAYSTETYPGDTGPKSFADFFDLESFPGRRGLRSAVAWSGHLQLVRLAQEPELLNTEEGKAAVSTPSREQMEDDFAWFADWADNAGNSLIYWSGGTDCPMMLISGELDMCTAWNGRISDAAKDGASLTICWECGHFVATSGWGMVAGTKELHPDKYELANLVAAWTTFAEINVEIAKYITYGPVNLKAIALIDDPAFDDVRDSLPTSPASAPYAVYLDEVWLGEQLDWAEEQYIIATQ
jgi:putative spermidine/putrescine transport system substrate-binding protein